jgi:hypothetical protein
MEPAGLVVHAFDSEAAAVSVSGAWVSRADARGVLTLSHPYAPSEAGTVAEASWAIPILPAGRHFVRFYLSDGYAGHDTGNAELGYPPERFEGVRFVSVRVGGNECFRQDVFGVNPPVNERFHQVEISADARGPLILRVEDIGSVEQPFATDVFWGMVSIMTVPEGCAVPTFGRRDVPVPALVERSECSDAPADMPELCVVNAAPCDRQEVVTSGVPFPQGFLTDPTRVGVCTDAGTAVPVQRRVLAEWPDGSVKSLLLDIPVALAEGAAARFQLTRDRGLAPTAGGRRLSVKEVDGCIVIDNGVAECVFSRSRALLERIRLESGPEMVLPGPLLRVQSYDGFPSQFFGNLAPDSLELLESGPHRVRLRARGAYDEGAGIGRLRYELCFDVLAGETGVRLYHTLINLTPGGSRLRTIAVNVPVASVHAATVDGYEGSLENSEIWTVQHTTERCYTWRYLEGDSELVAECRRGSGCAAAVAEEVVAGVSVRRMWQQYPNGFRVNAAGIQVDLWTSDRVPWVLGSDPPLVLAEGEAKTHELLIAFARPGDADRLRRRLTAFQYPMFAAASPRWYCASGIFGPVAPADPQRFPSYEAAVASMDPVFLGHGTGTQWDRIVDYTHEDRCTYQRYGFQNYGDNPLIWGYQTKYRMWANCEYDVGHCAFTQFARSGDRRYLERGLAAVLHNRDVDVIHASSEHPEWVGAPHGHWIRHTERAPNLGHLWSEGMAEHYLLTGDQRSLQIARGLGDYCLAFVKRGWTGGGERTAGWPMIALLGVYHASGDQKYLNAAESLMLNVVDLQDDLRGVWTSKIYEQPAYEGGTTFMANILCRALMRHYLATGDERAAVAVVRAAGWMLHEAVTQTPDGPMAFYKQTPLCARHRSADPETFAYAYSLTGSPEFLDLARQSLDCVSRGWANGVPTAAMRDLPRVLAILAG